MFKINKQVPIENLLTRQVTLWETTHRSEKAKRKGIYPNLSISRQHGSHGDIVVSAISKRLGWKIYDKEIVEYVANNTKVRKNIVELFDERTRREMDNLLSTLLDGHAMSNEMYLKHLARSIVSIGRHSCGIIYGRGSNFILPDSMALKIRIVENFDSRLKNLNSRGRTVSITAKQLKKDDNERAAFISRFFGEDIDNPANYDLVINLSKLSVKSAENVIINALHAKYELSENELKIHPN